MNSTEHNRVPRGVTAGGQFAPTAHAEPDISLGATFSRDTLQGLANRGHEAGAPYIDLTEYQLGMVREHLDSTGDFSSTGIRKAAEEAYFAENRYTPAEYEAHIASRGDISAYFGDPNALRRDIEQARKDRIG